MGSWPDLGFFVVSRVAYTAKVFILRERALSVPDWRESVDMATMKGRDGRLAYRTLSNWHREIQDLFVCLSF